MLLKVTFIYTLFLCLSFYGCHNLLEDQSISEAYKREFKSKSIEQIKRLSKAYIYANLTSSQFEANIDDTLTVAAEARKLNFNSLGETLVYRLLINIQKNSYTLSLRQQYKIVYISLFEGGEDNEKEERRSVTEDDLDPMRKTFDKIDRELYDYILNRN